MDDCGQGRDYRDHHRSSLVQDTVLRSVTGAHGNMVVTSQSLDLPHRFYGQTSEDGGSVLEVRVYYAGGHE